ncbi:MAG: Uma2 family endonuclease [Acidobacteriota bacterium]
MATRALDVRHWTREEYEQLAGTGFFASGQRTELVEGVIYEMSPQKGRHAAGIRGVEEALRAVFRQGYDIRTQLPIALGMDSEPEPDVAVVPGSWRDYPDAHPKTAVLIVEVSDSSFFHDRERKRTLYARAGIPEYWTLDLSEDRLEIYRNPGESGYQTRLLLSSGSSVEPLASPGAAVAIADILP